MCLQKICCLPELVTLKPKLLLSVLPVSTGFCSLKTDIAMTYMSMALQSSIKQVECRWSTVPINEFWIISEASQTYRRPSLSTETQLTTCLMLYRCRTPICGDTEMGIIPSCHIYTRRICVGSKLYWVSPALWLLTVPNYTPDWESEIWVPDHMITVKANHSNHMIGKLMKCLWRERIKLVQ